jgi:phosphatidylserine/phosphatidylglycerophosphate/cardiolipin synthase-like enzyme
VVVDAADYFRLARQAMLKAKSQIIMIGWDFDTRINLDAAESDDAPTELGAFINWLPKKTPGLQIHILKWDYGAIALLGRGTTALRLARWAASKNIHFRLDGAHPAGASHHQKILVIDDQLAFCGGIDMTADRWDTREHLDDDPGRRRPTTRRRYRPWHDATMAVDGPAAQALGELARERWRTAGGPPIARPPTSRSHPWPKDLEAQFREVDVAISRTRSSYDGGPPVREIEALFADQIRRAKRFVYAENQYFASRKVGEAIISRLREPDCPEFVIVNAATGREWLDDEAMSPARAKLLQAIAEVDRAKRFRIYSPVTEGGEDIYVHAKITIVDDELIRVGSANLNNRSMGLDSECDLTIDTTLQANRKAGRLITAIREDLLAEHLGVAAGDVASAMRRSKSLIRCIETLRGTGRTLKPLDAGKWNAIEEKLAEKEALDPESAGEEFEPLARPGLFAWLGR